MFNLSYYTYFCLVIFIVITIIFFNIIIVTITFIAIIICIIFISKAISFYLLVNIKANIRLYLF